MRQTIFGWVYGWVAQGYDRLLSWQCGPTDLGVIVLIGLRKRLRLKNLVDSGRGDLNRPPNWDNPPPDGHTSHRTLDGTFNDLNDPLMGSIGSRFGRNVPLAKAFPDPEDELLKPSPREVSRKLMTRAQFIPAKSLNVLAAAWIQFEVHDWLSHAQADPQRPFSIPLEDMDDWRPDPMLIARTDPDPSPPGPGKPPMFTTKETFWWDGSQVYGSDPVFAAAIRSEQHGRLDVDHDGLISDGAWRIFEQQDVARNFWIGLGMMHSLFMLEHNSVCDKLHRCYPKMTDDELYDTGRLVVSALMAKIHTVEWTPAVIAHRTTIKGTTAEWWGMFGEKFAQTIGRRTRLEIFGGIPGTRKNHFDVPFSLTEEFVAVYRMHPLMPDDFSFRAVADPQFHREYSLSELGPLQVRDRTREIGLTNAFYSFGHANPGKITLHNYPRTLQDLRRPLPGHAPGCQCSPDERLDLAAVDILRARERGVPRYNEFRRLFRLEPAANFDALVKDDPDTVRTLRELYDDNIEAVDLMVGLYSEVPPEGFAFSETAFRVFLLMASRRIKSDRFLTKCYHPDYYTKVGINWVESNTMRTVLMRHFGELSEMLNRVQNPFAPWDDPGNQRY